MQFIKYVAAFVFFILPFLSKAQSDYIGLGDKQYILLNRLDVKLKNDSILGFSTVKPLNRQRVVQQMEWIDSLYKTGNAAFYLSKVDKENLQCFLENNAEFTKNYSFNIRKNKGIFTTPQHLYAVKDKAFSIVIDPVLNSQYGKTTEATKTFINTRGILIRGQIDNKLGFYTYISDNQEEDPLYVQSYVSKWNALPGQGFFKQFQNTGYDYFNARGGVTFNTGKYFDLQFAYDKLFVGNGYRSLFLSDFSSNYLFLRFTTHIGKINYEAILAQTTAPFSWPVQNQHRAVPANYLAIHHLSWQMTKRFNFGLYENVMESGQNGFRPGYLNPIIFYKAIEQDYGIAGKTNIGFDFKWNALNNVQFYGQLLFNEFLMSEIVHYKRGSWENKQALQLGMKYIDAFSIKNFDLQVETNLIRPYTYTNTDSSTAFTNFNQPLAHPLGANVREFIAIAQLQPLHKLYITAKAFYFEQGTDSAGLNMGSNILKSYDTRARDYWLKIGSGNLAKTLFTSFTVSVETLPNLFVDGNISYRTYSVAGNNNSSNNVFYSFGIRWNIARRDFEF